MNLETGTHGKQLPTHLVWIDLEMTGLDTEIHRIVEVAMIITDFELREVVEYSGVIHQSEEVLQRSNQFSMDVHTQNGLYDKVRSSTLSEEIAEQEVCSLISKHVPADGVFLAGNSIRADRFFIDSHWSQLSKLLHYRMLDVSSFKLWWLGSGHEEFKKGDTHRALDDIRASIEELRYYTKHF